MPSFKIDLNKEEMQAAFAQTAEVKNLDGQVFDQFTIHKLSDGSRQWEDLSKAPIFLVKDEPYPY